jgi:hypothetical protein
MVSGVNLIVNNMSAIVPGPINQYFSGIQLLQHATALPLSK